MNLKDRLNGLDSLRALAILLVLIFHYQVVVSHERLFGFLSSTGWMGVDLFFVLSGYLIGNQVLSPLAKSQPFSFKLFYIRRFLRTLPNYYVVLALYFLVPSLVGKSTASLTEFFTFTQNLNMRPGETFTHSWSLCVEEQFYIFLPIVAVGCFWLSRSIKLFWSVMALAFLFPIGLRLFNWQALGGADISASDYWNRIYYFSATRFDELLPGVAIAAVKNFHPQLFVRAQQKGQWLFSVGLVNLALLFFVMDKYFYIEGYGFSGWIASLGFTWVAITFGLLTMAALSPQTALARVRIPGAAKLALWSYAIYLIHKPLFALLIEPLGRYGLDVNGYLGMGAIHLVSLIAGWLLFTAVETPFMRLRDRFFSVYKKSEDGHGLDLLRKQEVKA